MGEIPIKHLNGIIVGMVGRGEKPFLRYEILHSMRIMRIISTYVPPELRGMGIAERLVREAIKLAKTENLKIEPICSYAVYFFLKNREERALLVDWLKEKSDEELEKLATYLSSLEGR